MEMEAVVRKLELLQKSMDQTQMIVVAMNERQQLNVPSTSTISKSDLHQCQNVVRSFVKLLSNREEDPLVLEYDCYDSDIVARARERVFREIRFNITDKPCLTDQALNAAFKNIWRNRKDDYQRELSGKKDNHRANNRRNKRRIHKLNDRKKALQKSKRSADWKERAETVLTRELTSADNSEDEDSKIKGLVPIVWESSELTEVKDHLDLLRGKDLRRDHPTLLNRIPPSPSVPQWAIRERFRRPSGASSSGSCLSDTDASSSGQQDSSASEEPLTSTPLPERVRLLSSPIQKRQRLYE